MTFARHSPTLVGKRYKNAGMVLDRCMNRMPKDFVWLCGRLLVGEVPSAPQEGPPGDIATSTRPLLQPRSGRPALIRQQTLHQIVICRKCETSGLEGMFHNTLRQCNCQSCQRIRIRFYGLSMRLQYMSVIQWNEEHELNIS
ncbi:hypothetical protein CIHG_05600 [Coccidioides immitis H538.4]|uniref:Uncharacterized protein n=1 Tax=Coccidioides immitis H538.4 TaxID=396776 RepID=A0A0J8RST5_COCIT|nr:hypothetical protein CIHG_05600 [Coccidioides immitis H538.4]